MRRIVGVMVAAGLVTAACSSGSGGSATATTVTVPTVTVPTASTTGSSTTGSPTTLPTTEPATTTAPTTTEPVSSTADAATVAAIRSAVDAGGPSCDPLDTKRCLLPFPSDSYRADGRVAFPAAAMPINAGGVAMDPAEWNRNDGFSPNTPILTFIAGLDATASKLPSWTDLGASLEDNATVVLIDASTGKRVPLWAELDSKAASADDRLLEIHPSISLPEATTFVVGLRGIVAGGKPVVASPTFAAYRDRLDTGIAAIEARRPSMEQAFTALTAAGVPREDLQLAWSFTTASADNIAGRMLYIRDTALATLGDSPPAVTVTAVKPGSDNNIATQITGTFTVANFLTGDGGPGNRFNYGDNIKPTADAMPVQNGTLEAPFVCNISAATAAGTTPAHLVEYGHGLLGSNFEIDAGNVRSFANESNIVFCATPWAGLAEEDVGNAAATLGQMGNFPTVADRLQQGVLNQIFLGRLMIHPGGLAALPAFQRSDGTPLIDIAHLDYDGNSQGAIMGLMLAAVSPDIERAVLGVAGMNYSVLLSRSVDFATYEAVFKPAYPNDLDRVLVLALTQMLWDRGEGAGFVQHVTANPYAGTAAKTVLVHVAFGDWQVSELTAMAEARTLGLTIHRPVTAPGRSEEVDPGWGLKATSYPSKGSAIVVWDSGSDPIPFANVAPSTGRDPHEDPRADADVRRQKAAFLFDDTLIDVCNAAPCTADSTG